VPAGTVGHVKIDGYRNGWTIDARGELDLVLEYRPARVGRTAMTVSEAAGGLAFVVLLVGLRRRLRLRRSRTGRAEPGLDTDQDTDHGIDHGIAHGIDHGIDHGTESVPSAETSVVSPSPPVAAPAVPSAGGPTAITPEDLQPLESDWLTASALATV
jgi:hypothetical protein